MRACMDPLCRLRQNLKTLGSGGKRLAFGAQGGTSKGGTKQTANWQYPNDNTQMLRSLVAPQGGPADIYVCMYMYICIHVYIYISNYVYIYIYISNCVHIHIYIYMCMKEVLGSWLLTLLDLRILNWKPACYFRSVVCNSNSKWQKCFWIEREYFLLLFMYFYYFSMCFDVYTCNK